MLKHPLSYEEQINRLKEHGMIIDDPVKAESILHRINYYRFSGYALQFRKATNDSSYVDGTSFDIVLKLCEFDSDLRHLLRKYLEVIELYYRTVISHEFAMRKCINPPHDQHYNEKNYYDKIRFREIRSNFQKEKSYYKDSLIMKHHKKKYGGKMPLWVMVEMLSFSSLSKLYNCMYYSEKHAVANVPGINSSVLGNHLHSLSVLRNKCAHSARLYNTTLRPSVKLSSSFLRKYPAVKNDSLFAYMIVLVKRLPEMKQRQDYVDDILSLIDSYKDVLDIDLMGFPDNAANILQWQV